MSEQVEVKHTEYATGITRLFKLDKDKVILHACKECEAFLPVNDLRAPVVTCECGREVDVAKDLKFSHGLKDYGLWAPYSTGWRLKDRYDIMLGNGDIIHQTYPNGRSFHAMNSCHFPDDPRYNRIEDDDVIMIRLPSDDELVEKYTYRGELRESRNQDYFGDSLAKPEMFVTIRGVKCILR